MPEFNFVFYTLDISIVKNILHVSVTGASFTQLVNERYFSVNSKIKCKC